MLIIAVELYHIHDSPLIRRHTTTETSGCHVHAVNILQRAEQCQLYQAARGSSAETVGLTGTAGFTFREKAERISRQ